MASFLLKDIPPELHKRLKEEAARHRRSMAKHVLAILEENLGGAARREFPPPIKVAFPMTDKFLDKAKRWGRS